MVVEGPVGVDGHKILVAASAGSARGDGRVGQGRFVGDKGGN